MAQCVYSVHQSTYLLNYVSSRMILSHFRFKLTNWMLILRYYFSGSGELEFEEFCILAARFLIEEDEEQMRKELKEAFRFYDKEGIYLLIYVLYALDIG